MSGKYQKCSKSNIEIDNIVQKNIEILMPNNMQNY